MRHSKLIITLASGFLLILASRAGAMTAPELDERLQSGERFLLIDVRSNVHFTQGHIPGAMNIPIKVLPHKKLPQGLPVVVYADGRGIISETDALAALSAAGVKEAESLEGGFAAWQMHSSITTSPAGVNREKLPGITYQQLLQADRTEMVLIDLRKSEQQEEPVEDAETPLRASASAESDLVDSFANQLNMPIRQGLASIPSQNLGPREGAPLRASATGAAPAPLLVLVADDERTANQAARDLKAAGYHRFTILIGGTETILHEGRRGMGRQGGELPIISSQPR